MSREESDIADDVERQLRSCHPLEVVRIHDNVVARTHLGRASRVVLAGHLDTVPGAPGLELRLEGDTLRGLGSADMKGGLAVMLQLARDVTAQPADDAPLLDVTFAFYSGEEIARQHSGLLQIEGADPTLLAGDAAVLGEPTNGRIEAGCQGVVKLEVRLGGRRAHIARPWTGINAIHRLGPLLERVESFEERRPLIDGCEYRETLQAASVHAGVAGNVVPDEVTVILNHRFAPDRDEQEAVGRLEAWLSPSLDADLGDGCRALDTSPSAPPALAHPLLRSLARATGTAPVAKLAWTDVAYFSERGVPAVNLGPGDPEVAHTATEHVTGEQLGRVYAILRDLIFGTSPA